MAYHVDTCMTPMLLPHILSAAEEFAHAHIHDAGARDDVLIVVGCCYVEYVGRAQSTLEWGERVGIAKADGTVTAMDTLMTPEVVAENEMDITS